MAKMGQWLEMEIGITGGEEDGVNNEHVEKMLYTLLQKLFRCLRIFTQDFSKLYCCRFW